MFVQKNYIGTVMIYEWSKRGIFKATLNMFPCQPVST
jgi:hypothetical protein